MRRSRLLTALLAPALILACGGGGAGDTSPGDPADASSPGPADRATGAAADSTASANPTLATDSGPVWFGDYLSEGQCWDDSFDDDGDWDYSGVPEVRPCHAPHDNEVMLVATIGAPGAPYPGEDALQELGDLHCDPAFASFVGAQWHETPLDWFSLFP